MATSAANASIGAKSGLLRILIDSCANRPRSQSPRSTAEPHSRIVREIGPPAPKARGAKSRRPKTPTRIVNSKTVLGWGGAGAVVSGAARLEAIQFFLPGFSADRQCDRIKM